LFVLAIQPFSRLIARSARNKTQNENNSRLTVVRCSILNDLLPQLVFVAMPKRSPKKPAPKKTTPRKTAPESLIVPSSSGTTLTGAPALSPETTATEIQQEATTSPSLIDAAQDHGKGKRKATTDSIRWTIEDVARWLEKEGFNVQPGHMR
jgi:hypothetical protein